MISQFANKPSFRESTLVCCILAVAVGVLSLCSVSDGAEPLVNNLKVTALIPRDVPPTYYLDKKTGRPAGFAVDVMNKIAERAGIEVEYKFGENWADIFSRMKRGEADLVPDFGRTKEREKILRYGPPLETFQISFFGRSNQKGVEDIKDGSSVGVMSGSIPNSILSDRPSLNIVTFNSYQHALFDLLAGRIDAVAGPVTTIVSLARKSGVEDKIRQVGPAFSEIKRSIAVRRENVQLLERLEKPTKDFVTTNEYRRLYVQWYGKPAPFWTASRILMASGGLLLLIVGTMSVWRYRSILRVNRVLMKNIAERKRAEEALRLTEERYRGIVESQTEFIVRYLPGGIMTYINDAIVQYTGTEPSQLLGKSFYPFIQESDRERVINSVESLTKVNPVVMIENQVTLPDGRQVWHHWSHRALFDAGGTIVEYQSVGRDITERKLAEKALKTSHNFIEGILDTVYEGFIVIDRDYRIIQANRSYCQQAGLLRQDVIGKHCYEVSHNSDKPCFDRGEDCSVRDCFEKNQPSTYVHKFYGKDDSVIYTQTRAYPLGIDSGEVTSVIEVINNITDKYRLEEQILRTQKMEAVGLLAGGIAHDFNNLLTTILANISLAMLQDDLKDIVNNLKMAEQATFRATGLTQQLLTFSKGGAPIRRTASLGEIIRESAEFALQGSRVGCEFAIPKDLWLAEVDAGQISQVMHNLVINADQALPEGGTIAISCENAVVPAGSEAPLSEGKYVRVTVRDNGIGIASEHLTKIFDPYFTTKQRGSGLGLATAYSIIQKHGGSISVDSRVGAGTTFTLYLPANDAVSAVQQTENGALQGGRGKILLMDDDDQLRQTCSEALAKLGYSIVPAVNGDQAIGLFQEAIQSKTPFDAAILDLTIRGGMGGKETIARLLDISPELRAVVSSGYSNDPVMSDYRNYGFKDVLVKPYRVEDLDKTIRSLLRKVGEGSDETKRNKPIADLGYVNNFLNDRP